MTTQQQREEILYLTREERMNGLEISEKLGLSRNQVYHALHKAGVPLVRHFRKSKLAQYAAYDRADEVLVALGTAEEVGKTLGISPGSVMTYASKDNGKYQIVRIQEDEL